MELPKTKLILKEFNISGPCFIRDAWWWWYGELFLAFYLLIFIELHHLLFRCVVTAFTEGFQWLSKNVNCNDSNLRTHKDNCYRTELHCCGGANASAHIGIYTYMVYASQFTIYAKPCFQSLPMSVELIPLCIRGKATLGIPCTLWCCHL